MEAEFEIVEMPERPCVFIRRTVKRSGIGEAYMECLPKVFDYVGKHGKHVNGPFGRYTACSPDELTVEIGVMTETPLDGEGEIETGTFGGFRGLKGVHVGSYDRLYEASTKMNAYFMEQGYEHGGPSIELYVGPGNEPGTQPVTELYLQIA